MRLTIWHTNDLHGKLRDSHVEFLKPLIGLDDLFFDSGDAIRTGNLGVPLGPDPVWTQLAQLGCRASVPGNRESHLTQGLFERKIGEAKHPVLCANLFHKGGGLVLPPTLNFEHCGVRIGVIGLMVPMVTERMKTKGASSFLWTQPILEAQKHIAHLTTNADLVIALTHIGLAQDRELAHACPSLQLVLGGHSHTVLEPPERIGDTWICQGGSHARFIGRYAWEVGAGIVEHELLELPKAAAG